MATTEPENTSTVVEETAPEPEVRDYVNPPDPAPEPEEQEEQEAAPEPPPLEPGDEDYSEKVQKRISKAIAKQREAERRAEYWERQAQQEQEQRQPVPAGHTPADDQAPREDTFESYEDYVRAVARYEARQEWQANERIREARTKQARVDAKMKVGLEKYPDFAEVVFRPYEQGGPRITHPMFDACNDSDRTEDIAYYLAKHPDAAEEIASMTTLGVARAIGKIEAGIESGSIKLVAPTTTQAPPPIPHRVGGKEAGTDVDPDKLDIDEWMRREQEKSLKYK